MNRLDKEKQLKRPHILLVTTSYPLESGDVSGIFVKRLADALNQDNDLLVLTPYSRLHPKPEQGCPPVHCFRYAPHTWQRLAHEPGGIPGALKHNPLLWLFVPVFLLALFMAVLRTGRNTDLIHANWAANGLICGLAGKILRKPVITTLRGSDIRKLEHSRLNRCTLRFVLALNAHVATVSTPMQNTLHRLFPRYATRCSHIPNGVSDQLFSLPLTTFETRELRMVSIGNLIPLKGNITIINALKMLPDSIRLDIVGDGPERDTLEEHTRLLNLCDRVSFKGAIAPDHIQEVLADHDILILASHSEGRPNVVVEAMAAGRTVLASRLPGVEELIQHGHNGLLFEPGNSAEIAHAIAQILAKPEMLSTFGQAARQTVIDLGLSWPACARQYRHIYQQALRGDA